MPAAGAADPAESARRLPAHEGLRPAVMVCRQYLYPVRRARSFAAASEASSARQPAEPKARGGLRRRARPECCRICTQDPRRTGPGIAARHVRHRVMGVGALVCAAVARAQAARRRSTCRVGRNRLCSRPSAGYCDILARTAPGPGRRRAQVEWVCSGGMQAAAAMAGGRVSPGTTSGLRALRAAVE